MRKILALWAVPRSASTAFEIMMQQRGDFQVYHEPFGVSYYNSEDRVTTRPQEGDLQPEYNYDIVWQHIQDQAATQPVFVKDLANHLMPLSGKDFLSHFTNTFLIRDPAKALPSLFNLWQDFTLQEASYRELYQVFKLAQSIHDKPPVILDSDDLLADPAGMIRAYCQAVDIPFVPEALTWEAGSRAELVYWDGGSWHQSVLKTTGFRPQTATDSSYTRIEENTHLQQAYDFCFPYYEEMYANRLVV